MLSVQSNVHNVGHFGKTKRPLVRFHLTTTTTPAQAKDDCLKDSIDEVDSGAPSPELSQHPSLQSASLRLLHTQQRIRLLQSIEECLEVRAEYESARGSLSRLHEEVRTRLKNRIREIKTDKINRLAQAKKTFASLSDERDALEAQKARLIYHIEQHERQHENHQNRDSPPSADGNVPLVLKSQDKIPSKKADHKLAAGRLLREVIQLRSRLATLERKIEQENRRKKQAEEELAVLKAAMARNRRR